MKNIKKLYVFAYPIIVYLLIYGFNPLLNMIQTKENLSFMMLYQTLFFVCLSVCYCLYAHCVNTSMNERMFVGCMAEALGLLLAFFGIRELKQLVLFNFQIIYFLFILSFLTCCFAFYKKRKSC